MMFRCKNDKNWFRIAYRSETVEKEVKMGSIRPLPGILRMRLKAYIHR